jgi:hypothetical protein
VTVNPFREAWHRQSSYLLSDLHISEQVRALLEACSPGPENDVWQLRQQRMKLAEAGIEDYHADLRRSVQIYFLRGAEPIQVAFLKVDAFRTTSTARNDVLVCSARLAE